MEIFRDSVEQETSEGEYENREHDAFKASRNLLRNLDHLRQALEEREKSRFNPLVEKGALQEFTQMAADETFFSTGEAPGKEKAFAWLEKFSQLIDALCRAPQESMMRDSVESLNSLGMALSNMEQTLPPIFESLREGGLDAEETEKAEKLEAKMIDDIRKRVTFLGKRAKAINSYLNRTY